MSGVAPVARNAVLALEASTASASVAVLRGDRVLVERAVVMRPGPDEALMPAVADALAAADVVPGALAAVACGAGPGGFTSLRIAGAIAKGIAHAAGCALVAAPSLALAAVGRAESGAVDGGAEREWLVTLDALRGERYAARVATARRGKRVVVTGYVYAGVLDAAGYAAARQTAGEAHVDANAYPPPAAAVRAFDVAVGDVLLYGDGAAARLGPVDLDAWEPDYGRQAEAQARWELTHGRPLATALASAADA